MALTNSDLLENIDKVKLNPAGMQRTIIRALESSLGGEARIVDPTSPFVFLLEAACTIGTSAMQQSNSLNRKQYPIMANSYDDLFAHTADTDLVNAFSTPARTSLKIMLDIDEIYARSTQVPNSNGLRRLVIPKHTAIKVANMTFTMQYPIVIELTERNTIKAYLDTTELSPLQPITDNNLKWIVTRVKDSKCIFIDFPILQLDLISSTAPMNTVTGFSKEYVFSDQYHYTRVYNKVNGKWVEMSTTHSRDVYDPTIPTAVLQVANGTVKVTIPQIYLTKRMINDSLRIDIYTTKGPLDLSLANYSSNNFQIKFNDYDSADDNGYSSVLSNFSVISVLSTSTVVGGARGLTFTQLRNRVVNRSNVTSGLAITDRQIPDYIGTMGYGLVVDVDNITDRTFLATRDAPLPKNGVTNTGVDLSVHTMITGLNDLAGLETVRDHGNRITVLPQTLYSTANGVLSIVPNDLVTTMRHPVNTTPDAIANMVNSKDYLYTPYYYVYDSTESSFDMRVYDLDSPRIDGVAFIQKNDTLNVNFSIIGHYIEVTEGQGYKLTIEYDSRSDVRLFRVQSLAVQLNYDIGSNRQSYIEGHFVGSVNDVGMPANGRYIYQFDITTDFDINAKDQIILTPDNFPVNLLCNFDIITLIKNYYPVGAASSEIDTMFSTAVISDYESGDTYVGATQDRLSLYFGARLTKLWTRSRTMVDSIEYIRHTVDVPLKHSTDVLKYDANGSPVLTQNSAGAWKPTYLARTGDVVNDASGNPVIQYFEGDVMSDEYGKPRIKNGVRGILREVDLVLFDGMYYFATDELTTSYSKEVTQAISQWVTEDITTISKALLPRTELFYYPKTSSGNISVITSSGAKVDLPATQSLDIVYYVSNTIGRDLEAQDIIRINTKEVIASYFKESTLSKTQLQNRLSEALGDSVKALNITGFLQDQYDIVIMLDDSMRPSIGKTLIALSNLSLRVADTINIRFEVI